MHPMQSGDTGDVVDSSAYRLKATNGSPANTNTTSSNGASKQNGNNTPAGEAAYQNGGRRDSTQMWTPLLPQTQPSPGHHHHHHANGNGNGAAVNGGRNGGVAIIGGGGDAEGDPADVDASTMLYSPHHNNNDWKDAEELHNLKNGLLHHKAPLEGGLLNGKRTDGPYDEQDPLTGPRLLRHLHQPQLTGGHQQNNHHQPQQNNHQQPQPQPPHQHLHSTTPGYKPKKLPPRPDAVAAPDSDESDYEGAKLQKKQQKDPLNGTTSDKKSPSSSGFSSGSSGSMASSSGSLASSGDEDEDGSGPPTSACGLFGCHPKWARNFASTNVFMVVFLLAYILQGMYMTYFVSVITTIEKLFQIKSKTTGFLLSASEMGQISTALLLTYFAGRGHRPRWIACGMVLFSIAAFACSLPHFIFGKQLLQSSALLNGLPPPPPPPLQNLHSSLFDAEAWPAGAGNSSSVLLAAAAGPQLNLCILNASAEVRASGECDEDRKLEQASHSKITVIVLCIFFVSLLSSGIGQTAVATLGIPYIDDNVASKQSPMYMAITIGVRILGPASGFIVGSFCTRWYVNFSNPGFDASDPRWIGAWWMGPVVIGTLMMLSSIAMFSFPRQLRGKKPPAPANAAKMHEANGGGGAGGMDASDDKPKLKDFPKTVRRQLSNDILMFRTASCVFHLLPIAGLYTFLPKYLETQFRVATYDANMIAAFCGILVMGVGIVISGMVILKLKPSARSVAAWIAFTALVYSAGMVILMFVGCSMNDFAGYKESTSTTPAIIEPACSAALNCTCDKENFAPICGVDGKIYISACHAGCVESQMRPTDNRTVFTQCSCIPDSFTVNSTKPEAVSGYCDSNCKNFVLFILIFAVCVFMHSTSEVGSMLLVMRCTHPKDKAMAMGVIQSAIGLFGNVPCPIIYGAVVDSACLIWKTVCGKHGACSLYDADTFRHYFLGITAGIMFLAFIMDLVVWSKAHRIDITPEDGTDELGANGMGANGTAGESECTKAMASPDTRV